MRLLEIVRGRETGQDVIATSMGLAKTLGKVGVLVGNCRGFVGNRMFEPYQRESQFLLEEGARVEEVDGALFGFGMAMGPLAVGDLAGLDVGWRIRKEYRHLRKPGERQPLVADRLCEMGRYGQKTGAGWYRYEPGSRAGTPDPEVEKIIETCRQGAGIRAARSAPRKSSSAQCTPSSTRAPGFSRKVTPSEPWTSTSFTSTATASRPSAEVRCGTRTPWE